MKEIEGDIPIYSLVIDNKSVYENFEKEVKEEGSFVSELHTIQTRLMAIANRQILPSTKYRAIKGDKSVYKGYEIKTKHYRVYLFHVRETGKIIVYAGKKTNQTNDITHFLNLKQQFIKQFLLN